MQQTTQTVYWDAVHFRNWTFHLAATEQGLCSIMLPNGSFEAMRDWIIKYIPGAELVQDQERMHLYTQQLTEYLQGKRTEFDVPLDLRGTAFQVAVWKALLAIPYGEIRSYSDIAVEVQRPAAVRAVGAANGANPVPVIVPCHRVIGKNGKLTGYGGGLDVKAELLRLEGITDEALITTPV